MSASARIVRRQRDLSSSSVRPLKVVVTGPFAAGKTTLITTITEVAVVGTEKAVSDDTRDVKDKTTVAMDFGRITLADGLSLFLFGTPGQRRFEVMWEILSEGMIGFVVLVRSADIRSVAEAAHILETYRAYADVPVVIGVTHLDEAAEEPEAVVAKMRAALEIDDDVPVLPCDPRDRTDVKNLLLEVLFGVLRRLEAAGTKQ